MRIKAASLILFAMQYCCNIYAQAGLTVIKDFGTNPGNLHMYMHIPQQLLAPKERHPLVIVLHGCLQTAKLIEEESGWDKLADHFGFYTLYPQQKFGNNPGGCFNWFNKHDVEKDKGEVLSIRQMIDHALAMYPVDSNKIFIYGVSAGAAMAAALMADYPFLFNAGAIVAGMAFADGKHKAAILGSRSDSSAPAEELAAIARAQNPGYNGKYPRLIIWHGSRDKVVSISNAYTLIKQWTGLYHTDDNADDSIISFQNHPDITKYIYRDSAHNEIVAFYKIDHLAHNLMIDPGEAIDQGGKKGWFTVEAGIHSTYWIALDLGLFPPQDLHR